MKNKVTYFIAVLFAACACFSCSDDDNKDDSKDLTGNWKYSACHFEFEYADKTIALPEGMTLGQLIPDLGEIGSLQAIPVTMISPFVKKFADVKMTEYFKGVEFMPDMKLMISMMVEGKPVIMPATYKIQGNVIGVTLDKEALKKITGEDLNIPMISLNYILNKDILTLYLDNTTIQGMLSVLLPDLIIEMMPVDTPPAQLKAMEAYFKGVLGKITKLEIGAQLTR